MICKKINAETFAMAPPRSSAEAWKHMEKLDGQRHVKCKLCNIEFVGSLTRVMDHLLSFSNGRGGGVEGCKVVSAELKEILQKDYDKIKRAKQVQENKKQRVQSEIEMNYRLNPFSSFSPTMSTAGSSHQQAKTSGTPTLNTL